MPKTEPKTTAAPNPHHTVAGHTFVWNSPDPEVGEVRIPLKFDWDLMEDFLRKPKELRRRRAWRSCATSSDSVLGDAGGDPRYGPRDAGEVQAMFACVAGLPGSKHIGG
jgi:hypothetical protein